MDVLDAASRALAGARQADAPQLDAADFRSASRHFDQAQAAVTAREYAAAAQLALQSTADSELATARARAEKARDAVARIERENATLRSDLGDFPVPGDQP